MDKETLREFFEIQVDEDVWREFKNRRNGALLGIGLVDDSKLRRKFSWSAGRSFALPFLAKQDLFMAGSFVPRDPTLRKVILTGAEFMQDAVGVRGEASQILVKVAHRDNVESVSQAINALPHSVGLQAASQRQALDEALTDLDEMLKYATTVMLAVGLVILLGLANATSMAVRERVREVGMLRSLGFSRRRVVH